MRIEYESNNKKFVAISRYEEKDILKMAHFHYNPEIKHWETNSIQNVKNLEEFLTPEAKKIYESLWDEYNHRLEISQATDSTMEIPHPNGMHYYPFQKAGIEALITRRNVLLADEMGLGKTIQVIGYLNYAKPKKVLIIMPLSVKTNWYRELQTWLTYDTTIEVINGKEPKWDAEITLIHYDVLKKYRQQLTNTIFDVVVMDEAHYIKNFKAQRTVSAMSINGRKKILLTGTPILNHPNEIFTLLQYLGSTIIINPYTQRQSYTYFVNQYCLTNDWEGHVQIVGGRNLEDLQLKLRASCMVRRLKKDVLVELPEKVRQMIPIPRSEISKSVLQQSDKILEEIKKHAGSWEEVLKLLNTQSEIFEELARARHQLGVSKIPMAISFIEDVLENEQKVVVFAHHRDVVEAIANHFPGSAVVYGGMDTKERDYAISEFNTNPNCRVFIGSITTAGMGINLQTSGASIAVFVEIDWRPAYNVQAEDRIHRVGQKNSVTIYNLVVDNSLDGYIATKVLGKQKDISTALDDKITIVQEVDSELEELKTQIKYDDIMEGLEEKKERKEAYEFTMKDGTIITVQVPLLLRALKLIVNMDEDMAMRQNGVGFNKLDTGFGHILGKLDSLTEKQARIAHRILRKYKRQLPEELYDSIYRSE